MPTTATLLGRARFVLLLCGAIGLVMGLWLGLARMGAAPAAGALSVLDHGPLMVSGFLGTVIALERAVAHRHAWGYLAPGFNAAGTLLVLVWPGGPGPLLLTAGSLVVVAILVRVVRMDPALHHLVLISGSLAWLTGNVLFTAGVPVFDVVVWWLLFLVVTIAAERLELNRLLRPTRRARAALVAAVAVMFAGGALGWVHRGAAFRVLGLGMLALAAWLGTNDVARRTVRQTGVTRFIAASLLAGYVWLAAGGAIALWAGHPVAGPVYDALLHTVFVGFVFSMIFGHALVIVPAVLGVRVAYRPRFYAHLGALHASLLLRLAGDLAASPTLRSVGAWLNVAAITLFLFNTVSAASAGQRPAPAPAPRPAERPT